MKPADYSLYSFCEHKYDYVPGYSNTSYHKSIDVVNCSGFEIMVLDRSGLPVKLSSTNEMGPGIHVICDYDFGTATTPDPYGYYMNNLVNDEESKFLLNVVSLKTRNGIPSHFHHNKKGIFTLPSNIFRQVGKAIYLMEFDIVITSDTSINHIHHPDSCRNARMNKLLDKSDVPRDAFSLNMFIVTTGMDRSPMFINVHGNVYKIPVIVNSSYTPGFYVGGSSALQGDANLNRSSEVITIEEAKERFRLYETYNDARLDGDVKQKYEAELAKLNKEIEELKLDAKKLEQKNKIEALNKQGEIDEKTHGLKVKEVAVKEIALEKGAHYDFLAAERKAEYERDSYQRKTNYEATSVGLKTSSSLAAVLPAIIGGVIGVIGLIFKFFFK